MEQELNKKIEKRIKELRSDSFWHPNEMKEKTLESLNKQTHELIHDCTEIIDKESEDGRVIFLSLAKLSAKLTEMNLKSINQLKL